MPLHADQLADTSRVELLRLARIYDFPSFVKKADIGRALAPRKLEDHVYADVPNKQFPCDDAVSTYLSALYYQEKRADFHPKDQARIDGRIETFATYWRILPVVKAAQVRWQETHRSTDAQLPDSDFADIWLSQDGRKERNLRMKTAMETKAAAEHLVAYRDAYSYERRHVIARRILEKTAKFGAAIGPQREFLERQAGMGCGKPSEIIALVRDRALMIGNAAVKTQFLKMAETIEKDPQRTLQPKSLVKLAETLDKLDRANGFVRRYADGLQRPDDVIFSATFSKAAAEVAQHVEFKTGNCYEKAAFRRLPLAEVKALFGDDFAGEVGTALGEVDVEKMAAIASTLPLGEASQLDTLLSDNGIAPSLRKAAAVRQGFDDSQIVAFADSYRRVG